VEASAATRPTAAHVRANKARAADILGISRGTLYNRLKRYILPETMTRTRFVAATASKENSHSKRQTAWKIRFRGCALPIVLPQRDSMASQSFSTRQFLIVFHACFQRFDAADAKTKTMENEGTANVVESRSCWAPFRCGMGHDFDLSSPENGDGHI
jgi:Bacterial regulatory protein, Fis family